MAASEHQPMHARSAVQGARKKACLTVKELMWLGRALVEAETTDDPKQAVGESAALAIRLILFTGARLNEILTLRWENIDLDRGACRLFPQSKTEDNKTLFLSTPAVESLAPRPST